MNKKIETILRKKDYVIKSFVFDIIKSQDLDLNDTVLLIYLLNQEKPVLDINLISETTKLDENEIMTSFAKLTDKKIITTEIIKKDGIIEEIINIENIYKLACISISEESKDQEKTDIFSTFEKEFGRTLSPVEYELINAWLEKGINEEIIIGALKEAIYNGVSNLRYIDKIIYEWNKKGFKTMEDVKKHITNKESKEYTDDGFDYNWLDEDE